MDGGHGPAKSLGSARVPAAWRALVRWFDAGAGPAPVPEEARDRVDCAHPALPRMHLACLAVFWVGVSPVAVAVAVAMYVCACSRSRASTTATSRTAASRLAAGAVRLRRDRRLGRAARAHLVGRAPPAPPRPLRPGDRRALADAARFLWSHMAGSSRAGTSRPTSAVCGTCCATPSCAGSTASTSLVPFLLALGLLGLGSWLGHTWPGLGTSGGQMLVWASSSRPSPATTAPTPSTRCATCGAGAATPPATTVATTSLLALITLGEGWHNNHHRYPMSVRQGFYWWEVDITYYLLRGLAAVGLIWDLKPVPARCATPTRR